MIRYAPIRACSHHAYNECDFNKERKIYELAASGEVPCTRAVGKLLFSRHAIESWLRKHSVGPDLNAIGGDQHIAEAH